VGVAGTLAGVAVAIWAAVLSAVDLRQRRLPNLLTLSGTAVILLGAVLYGRGLPAVLGAAALGVLYLAVHLAAPAALGGGDVKLALALGALTGAFGTPVWVLAALGAPVLTAIAGTVVLVLRRGRIGLVVPHGPSMCLASLAAAALAVF
jgi:leader peptidase (prepilin peptidase)/N-methyltransferase